MGQERVVGHAPIQRCHEGIDVVQPLAGEVPFGEQVLVRVRHGRRVRVDARVTGEDAREERAGGARGRDADARLQDRVALGDAAAGRVEMRPIQRVRDDADELLGGVARQARVGVERDAVAHAGQDREVPDLDVEARVPRPSQEPIELLELASLSLPSHPRALARIPLARAMEQEEPVATPFAEPGVQRLDAAPRRSEDGRVLGHLPGGGIDVVAENREVDAGVEVPEREDLDVVDELLHPAHARQQRGHHHERPGVLGDARREIEAWQRPRGHEACGETLGEGDGHLARRYEHEQRHDDLLRDGAALLVRVRHACAGQRSGEDRDRPEVHARGVGEGVAPDGLHQPWTVGHVGFEAPPALPDEVVTHVRSASGGPLALGRLARALHGPQGDADLGLSGAFGQLLDGLPATVPAREVHAAVDAGGIALQHPFDEAHRLDVLAPVELGAEAQARDDVRDRDLGGGLALVLAPDGLLGRHGAQGEVILETPPDARESRAVLAHALQELHDMRRVQQARERWRLSLARRVDPRHVDVGGAPGGAGGQQLVREAPQVLDEGELQHARPGPELADRERGDRLEALEETHELLAVEAAVAVPYQLHRDGVHAGVAGLLSRRELGQLAVVATREVVAHLPDLGGDEVVVVEEPLPCGRDELALMDVVRQGAIGVAQDAGVVVEPRKHAARGAARARVHGEPRRERVRPLLQALDAQELVAERLLGGGRAAVPAVEEP